MRYFSSCGRYRVDAVRTTGRTKWRAMIFVHGRRWEFLRRKYYATRDGAEQACEKHADLPAVCQPEFAHA
jgi:hypothetical protein